MRQPIHNVPCPGPVRRREFLQAGLLAAGGLTLADVLAARALAGESHRETSVIVLYLHGGPSQLETYDLKPKAPIEYRSVFEPISTNVRDGGIEVLTGKTPVRPDPASLSKSEHPDLGSVASRLLGPHPAALPRYVAIPQQLYMVRPAYLGLHHGPLGVGDPAAENFKPPTMRIAAGNEGRGLDDRAGLIRQFDRLKGNLDQRGSFEGTDKFRELAVSMLTGPQVADAFDLSQEPHELRDRYGRTHWGQSCLLARRLCEAGTSVVTVYIDAAKSGPEFTNWDDHIQNAGRPGHFAQYMRNRLPYLDQALSALLEDIYSRGSDQRIMVAVFGEFGRTPRLSHNVNGTGRDHWPDAQSVLLAGGGLKTGQVVGATNSKAEFPTERPLTPKDILATIYRHLGIDRHIAFLDHAGRPVPVLSEGTPIAELI
ncbi:MAG: DUF1501 domain-containing protein [Planctomycetota bacterium]|nr:DUF1501 domain-containing protein [Planctomycetota bacterium]